MTIQPNFIDSEGPGDDNSPGPALDGEKKTMFRYRESDDEALLSAIRHIFPFEKGLDGIGENWNKVANEFNAHLARSVQPGETVDSNRFINGIGARRRWESTLYPKYSRWVVANEGASGVQQVELKHQRLLSDIVQRLDGTKEKKAEKAAQKSKDAAKRQQLKEDGEKLRQLSLKKMKRPSSVFSEADDESSTSSRSEPAPRKHKANISDFIDLTSERAARDIELKERDLALKEEQEARAVKLLAMKEKDLAIKEAKDARDKEMHIAQMELIRAQTAAASTPSASNNDLLQFALALLKSQNQD